MLAFAAVVAAAVSSIVPPEPTWRPPAPLPGDGRVVARDGVRFRLPPGLSYAASDEKGDPVWTARSADGTTVVAVKAFRSDATLPCRTTSGAIQLDAFTTARGLRGCIGTAYADDSPLALTQAFVKGGDVVVSVFAIAAEEAVEALAKAVADSVEVDE